MALPLSDALYSGCSTVRRVSLVIPKAIPSCLEKAYPFFWLPLSSRSPLCLYMFFNLSNDLDKILTPIWPSLISSFPFSVLLLHLWTELPSACKGHWLKALLQSQATWIFHNTTHAGPSSKPLSSHTTWSMLLSALFCRRLFFMPWLSCLSSSRHNRRLFFAWSFLQPTWSCAVASFLAQGSLAGVDPWLSGIYCVQVCFPYKICLARAAVCGARLNMALDKHAWPASALTLHMTVLYQIQKFLGNKQCFNF